MSDDLIRRQAAIEALENDKALINQIIRGMSLDDVQSEHYVAQHNQVVYDIYAIEQLPSAQPEIIRCKECKYASPNGKYGCKAYHFKLYETHEMKADDFCSRAERRDNG